MRLDLRHPTAAMINRFDIAAGLSRICRWSGQTSEFYSVAEHSVRVAQLVPPEHRLQALLHDAPEAYIGDMARPLKDLCPDFRAVEAKLWEAIAEKFGVAVELSEEVKAADDVMLVTERRDLMPNADDWGWEGAPAPDKAIIQPWLISTARKEWLRMLEGLTR